MVEPQTDILQGITYIFSIIQMFHPSFNQKLYWLPLKLCIIFKLLPNVSKFQQGVACSSYMAELLSMNRIGTELVIHLSNPALTICTNKNKEHRWLNIFSYTPKGMNKIPGHIIFFLASARYWFFLFVCIKCFDPVKSFKNLLLYTIIRTV